MESFKVHARTTGKGLHRSLSFISKSSDDDSEQFEFRRRVQTSATGLDKPKQRVTAPAILLGLVKEKGTSAQRWLCVDADCAAQKKELATPVFYNLQRKAVLFGRASHQ